MSVRPILIVEDDAALRATLVEQLIGDGNFLPGEAESAADAEAMLDAADARYDAILLDIGLPDADGREFCAKLRRDGKRMPVIMLTGADAEQDVVRGLDAGANDYIAKPFRLNELLARVRAQLRVFDNSEDAVFTIGPYMFRPSGIQPLHGVRSKTGWINAVYALTAPLLSWMVHAVPSQMTTSEKLGRAMIKVARDGYPKPILESEDINAV